MFRPVYILPFVFLAFLSGAVSYVKAHRAPPPAVAVGGWEADVLAGLGNAAPTPETIAYLAAWHRAEGGSASFNWLNTTQDAPGATDYNSVGVKNYPDYESGVAATVQTLTNGFYPRTLAGLRANAPVVDDGELGTWGTGSAGILAQLEQPAIHKCGFTDTMAIGEGSSFYSTGSGYWTGQYGGMHLGDDFIGNPGDPVYAPWDMTVDSVGEYTDPGRFGKNIQAHLASDGYLFYAGHLIDVYVQAGQFVSACTQIGTLGATAGPHTHIKMASPNAPIPCEGSEPGPNGCIDPMEYYEEH